MSNLPLFAAVGSGFSGTTDNLAEAELWVMKNGSGAVYRRIDYAADRAREDRASDLHDALKELAAALDEATDCLDVEAAMSSTRLHKARNAAEAAIAKAEGK